MRNETVKSGMKASAPIMISYAILGIACGIVLYDAGFGLSAIFLMSALLFAGAAQFLTAGMVVAGASFPSIVLMVFFLNLRHLLMSASISRHVKEKTIGFIGLFSHTLSDETFGINYSRFEKGDWTPNEAIVTNLVSYSTWVMSTVIGGAIGSQFTINTMIMNYALIAMFLCMMVQQFVSRAHVLAGGAAMLLTVGLKIILQHNIALVIAAVLASCLGYILEKSEARAEGVKASE